jgi:hypothetical protein
MRIHTPRGAARQMIEASNKVNTGTGNARATQSSHAQSPA